MNEKLPTWLKHFLAILIGVVMVRLVLETYMPFNEYSNSVFMLSGYARHKELISQFVSPCIVIISYCIVFGMMFKSMKEIWKTL
jgi:hypothetical protein